MGEEKGDGADEEEEEEEEEGKMKGSFVCAVTELPDSREIEFKDTV